MYSPPRSSNTVLLPAYPIIHPKLHLPICLRPCLTPPPHSPPYITHTMEWYTWSPSVLQFTSLAFLYHLPIIICPYPPPSIPFSLLFPLVEVLLVPRFLSFSLSCRNLPDSGEVWSVSLCRHLATQSMTVFSCPKPPPLFHLRLSAHPPSLFTLSPPDFCHFQQSVFFWCCTIPLPCIILSLGHSDPSPSVVLKMLPSLVLPPLVSLSRIYLYFPRPLSPQL